MIILGSDTVVEEPTVELPHTIFPPASPRLASNLYLTGVDGSVWNLTDGPVRVQAGFRPGYAEPEHWTRTSPALDGSTWEGFRTPAGEVFLPIRVLASDSLTFRDIDSALAGALDPSGEVQLTLIAPDGQGRVLTARYESGFDTGYERDPLMMRHAAYGLTLATYDPYWRGAKRTITFGVAESPPDFFPGPPWNLNPGNSTDAAVVSNPGDVAVWPKWTITGPFASVTVGVGSSVVTLGADVYAGESRIIDMDPSIRSITDQAGADAWLDATEAEFAPIPAGSDVPLSVDLTGGTEGVTTIAVAFTPAYRRPW